MKTCICGDKFKPNTAAQKFCSIPCGLKHAKPTREVECGKCGVEFTHQGRGRREFCTPCQKKRRSQQVMASRKKRQPNIKVGIGSGGAQSGADNHRWVADRSTVYVKYDQTYKSVCRKHWDMTCAACSTRDEIEIHHIDLDPMNPAPGNLVPLCRRHHLFIHYSKCICKYDALGRLGLILTRDSRIKIAELSGKALEKVTRTEGDSNVSSGAEHRS